MNVTVFTAIMRYQSELFQDQVCWLAGGIKDQSDHFDMVHLGVIVITDINSISVLPVTMALLASASLLTIVWIPFG